MNKDQQNDRSEPHPLFPSGDWEGFYTYAMGPQADKHPMQFMLNFKANVVEGSGGDDVGSFSWRGSYSKEQMDCVMTKYYSSHTVHYQGQVDENGIWGVWEMEWLKGGFHIWPKASANNQEAAAIAVKEKVKPELEKVPVVVPKERKI